MKQGLTPELRINAQALPEQQRPRLTARFAHLSERPTGSAVETKIMVAAHQCVPARMSDPAGLDGPGLREAPCRSRDQLLESHFPCALKTTAAGKGPAPWSIPRKIRQLASQVPGPDGTRLIMEFSKQSVYTSCGGLAFPNVGGDWRWGKIQSEHF